VASWFNFIDKIAILPYNFRISSFFFNFIISFVTFYYQEFWFNSRVMCVISSLLDWIPLLHFAARSISLLPLHFHSYILRHVDLLFQVLPFYTLKLFGYYWIMVHRCCCVLGHYIQFRLSRAVAALQNLRDTILVVPLYFFLISSSCIVIFSSILFFFSHTFLDLLLHLYYLFMHIYLFVIA
jgi:hypothetical protein